MGHGYLENTNSWYYEQRERHRELASARRNSLNKWLKEKGFESMGYQVPHKGQFVLVAGKPDEEWPHHSCLCKSEIWVCEKCVCKNWQISKLDKCGNNPMWVLRKIKNLTRG